VARRSLIAVALFLSLIAGALVTAQPTAAIVTNCGVAKVINNSHGRLEVTACVESFQGGYRSYARYSCYKSGQVFYQPCNIAATQVLWYNASPVKADNVNGCCIEHGIASYAFNGTPAGCTSAWIKTVVKNIRVRFNDRTLWSTSNTAQSPPVAGDPTCA
jgi:hypothetical protein